MDTLIRSNNILGAIIAVAFYISAILVFALRLMGKQRAVYWLGVFELCLALPMIYLLIQSAELNRPLLYYIQIGLMLAWLIAELFLDYVMKINFRKVQWIVIVYVMLFFAGTGGMLGVAANAGRDWSIVSTILFLIMAVLAFVQRAITKM